MILPTDLQARWAFLREWQRESGDADITQLLEDFSTALAEALEDGARLSDALDVTHARFLAADEALVREGQQAAALINRLAGAVSGESHD